MSVAASPNASVSGVVNDATGAPVSGVTVTLRGPQSYNVTSDAKGVFSFDDVRPGVYSVTAARPGYDTAREDTYAVVAGSTQRLTITIAASTFTSLHTIASVSTAGRSSFNTSPASISSVSTQAFLDQGATGLGSVLNEVPGLQISLPSNDGNGAAPGAIQFANIRDGLAFETATLIDGHPLSVGKYGDYVLSFWTPYMFESYDVIKGPGADAPQTNYAINGTLNMRTLDPTRDMTASFLAGVTGQGGNYFDYTWRGTTGRLGFVAAIAEVDEPSVVNNHSVYFGNTSGAYVGGANLGYASNSQLPVPGAYGYGGAPALAYNSLSFVACCYPVTANLFKLNELLKFRYRFSPATVATVSYLGSQATSDENGDTLEAIPSAFQPSAGYNGPIPVGTGFLVSNTYPASDTETNNEPMFQAEVSTTLGKDTILARYYHASIFRLISQGNSNPQVPTVNYFTINGTVGSTAFNNVNVPVAAYEYFQEDESDSLSGVDLQYQHPFGDSNTLTASLSHTNSTTSYWEAESDTANFPVVTGGVPDVTIPEGSGEVFNTYRLTDNQNLGNKWNALASLYQNEYAFTSAIDCGSGASYTSATACKLNGSNATFRTQNPTHFDGRLGLTYRPTNDLIFRAAMGSSIAPPYINLLSKFTAVPSCSAACANPNPPPITVSENNPNLVPETAFGYDVGADYRLKHGYLASADVYLTNLYNQFLSTTVDSGLTCNTTNFPTSNCPGSGGPEVYYSYYGNVNNSRYEGVEVSLKRQVVNGIGFVLQGSTQRGYAYNLGTNFYCNFAPQPNPLMPGFKPCIPATYNQNLAVIAGQNFNGGSPTDFYYNGVEGANNVSNQAVPYLQGSAEINWQNAAGWYAAFGGTLFGKNNYYNEPPFTVARISVRAPLGNGFSLQVSGSNIFNAYSSVIPIEGAGVGIPLANGGVGATVGNVVGPAVWTVRLTKLFGGSHA